MENLNRVDDLLLTRQGTPRDKLYDQSRVAIFYEGKTYSYYEMYQGMMTVAAKLCEYRMWQGERVIVHLGNRPEAIMAMMGCSYMGCTFVPVASTIKAHRLAEIINDCEATAIITDAAHVGVLSQLGELKSYRLAFNIDEIPIFNGFVNRSKAANPAAILYTSGTTGKPKGVCCPQEKIMAAISSINAYMMHTADDIIATALPLSHGYGLYQVLTAFEAGGAVLLEPNFSFPQQTLLRIKQLKATGFAIVPSMVPMIMQIDDWDEYLDCLTYITTAGAHLPAPTYRELRKNLLGTDIIPMYGQTECVRALYYPAKLQGPVDMLASPDTIHIGTGVPIPDTEVKLVDEEGNTGVREGELWVKSPHVMGGYWMNTEATAETFTEDGWLRTGDIFTKDDYGMYYYRGRMDEVVKIKGERVSPQELDDALLRMHEIDEAASFAMLDPGFGYRFVAYVVSKDYILTRRDVMRYCRRELEHHLLPKDVIVVKKIPKTENGKISRAHLQEIYETDK